MAERGYINIDGLPESVIPLPADAMVEVEIDGGNYKVPYSELGGTPATHAASHKDGGSDEIASSTPGAGVIPKADGNATLNDWIAPATESEAGKVVLAASGETSAVKALKANDPRLTDPRYPTAHGNSHVSGADPIPNATTTTPGLMSAEDKTAFDAYDPSNLPSDGEKAALAGTYGTPSDTNRYVTDDDPRLETLVIPETLAVHEEQTLASVPPYSYRDRIEFEDEIYVSVDGGDIYKEVAGALVATGQTTRSWRHFAIYNNELYCTVYGGDIYKMNSSGVFQATGQTARYWVGIEVFQGSLVATVYNDDLYEMDAYGVFQATGVLSGESNKAFTGLAIDHETEDLIVAVNGSTCKRVSVADRTVSSIGSIARNYYDVCDDGESLWAITYLNGSLYKLSASNEFETMCQYKYTRLAISFSNNQLYSLGANSYNEVLVEKRTDKLISISHGYIQLGAGFESGNDVCLRSTEGPIHVDLTVAGDTIDGAGFIEIEPEGFVYIQKINVTEWAYCSSSKYKELSPSTPAIRIAALINETTSADVAATYAVVSNICTITLADHGHLVNHIVYLDITSGGGTDGWYIVTGVTKDTFTVSMTVANTSGNVTLKRMTITKGVGIHSACGLGPTGGNAVAINFEEAAPDANFWYSYGCGTHAGVYAACVKEYATVGTTSRTNAALCLMGISYTSTTWVWYNFNKLSVQIFW